MFRANTRNGSDILLGVRNVCGCGLLVVRNKVFDLDEHWVHVLWPSSAQLASPGRLKHMYRSYFLLYQPINMRNLQCIIATCSKYLPGVGEQLVCCLKDLLSKALLSDSQ